MFPDGGFTLLAVSRRRAELAARGARAELFLVGGAALAVGCASQPDTKPVQGYRQADGERRRRERGPATSGYDQPDEHCAIR
jgi:hypothetical protein